MLMKTKRLLTPIKIFSLRTRLFFTSIHRLQEEADISAAPKAVSRPASSVPHGQVIKGVNYLKTQPDPIAKPDEEYPDWLWTLLDPKEVPTDVLSREYQKKKNKDAIKAKNFLKKR